MNLLHTFACWPDRGKWCARARKKSVWKVSLPSDSHTLRLVSFRMRKQEKILNAKQYAVALAIGWYSLTHDSSDLLRNKTQFS